MNKLFIVYKKSNNKIDYEFFDNNFLPIFPNRDDALKLQKFFSKITNDKFFCNISFSVDEISANKVLDKFRKNSLHKFVIEHKKEFDYYLKLANHSNIKNNEYNDFESLLNK